MSLYEGNNIKRLFNAWFTLKELKKNSTEVFEHFGKLSENKKNIIFLKESLLWQKLESNTV